VLESIFGLLASQHVERKLSYVILALIAGYLLPRRSLEVNTRFLGPFLLSATPTPTPLLDAEPSHELVS
jgi:hypothetical protein